METPLKGLFILSILLILLGNIKNVQDNIIKNFNNIVISNDSSQNHVFIKFDSSYLENIEKIKLLVKITSYNNHVDQCDASPNIMASNRLVYEGAVAISRDLKKKYGLKYGDLVYIDIFKKYYIIEDLMNERIKNTIDIFNFDEEWSKTIHLKNQKVIIYKIKR